MGDLIEVCAGKLYKVSMTPQVFKEYKKTDAAIRARCEKWMRFYADDGHEFLDDQKLKREGRFPSGVPGGTDVVIWAFKAKHLRVYGGVVDGCHFIATEIDTAKKQSAANQGALKSAAKKLAAYGG
jgi:hypothetical protein